jgi:hypothetical protein
MVSYSIVELVESSTRSKFRKKEEKKPAQCKKKGAPLCFNNFYSFLCLFAFSFKLFSKFSLSFCIFFSSPSIVPTAFSSFFRHHYAPGSSGSGPFQNNLPEQRPKYKYTFCCLAFRVRMAIIGQNKCFWCFEKLREAFVGSPLPSSPGSLYKIDLPSFLPGLVIFVSLLYIMVVQAGKNTLF